MKVPVPHVHVLPLDVNVGLVGTKANHSHCPQAKVSQEMANLATGHTFRLTADSLANVLAPEEGVFRYCTRHGTAQRGKSVRS